jgi:protein-tyrosine-phosphatase
MPAILFVCTYNRFRSPLAAEIFRAKLRAAGLNANWIVESAGSWVKQPAHPMPQAFIQAKALGLTLPDTLSREVTSLDLTRFDRIFVMETGQKEALQLEFPVLREKIFLLSELSQEPAVSIPDPFASNLSPGDVAAEIESYIQTGFDALLQQL